MLANITLIIRIVKIGKILNYKKKNYKIARRKNEEIHFFEVQRTFGL